MGAVWAQTLPNHQTGFGIEVCRCESLDPDRDVKVTGDLIVNKMELV